MSKVKSWLNSWALGKQTGCADNVDNGRLYNEFSLLAKNRFKWEGLPQGIESRHIENFLFNNGQLAFFKDNERGFFVLPCHPNGNLNVYGDALQYQATGIGYSKTLHTDEMVRILCNDNAVPNAIQVEHYSQEIEAIEQSARMNVKQQRYPWLIATTKETELSLKNIFKKIDRGEEQIFVDSRLSQGGTLGAQALNTNTPYVVDRLRTEKNELMNELLSWLGLNNTSSDKKERLLVDEVNVNNNHILMNLDIEFKNRQKACKEINEMFGLNISVSKTIDELEVTFKGSEEPQPVKKGLFK